MFTIKVSEDIIDHCKNVISKYNFGQRHTANGTPEQQLTGIIGESIVKQLFRQRIVTGDGGFDDVVDLVFNELKIDIKTMGRTTDVRRNYTNNFLKLQDYFSTEIYIFCSYNKRKKQVTICGWIDKKTFTERRKYFPKGTARSRFDGTSFKTFADLYEIDNHQLFDVNSIDELKLNLNKFK